LDRGLAQRKASTYTQHRKTWTHIHALSGFKIHDPHVQAVKDSTCLRLLGLWDWHQSLFSSLNFATFISHHTKRMQFEEQADMKFCVQVGKTF